LASRYEPSFDPHLAGRQWLLVSDLCSWGRFLVSVSGGDKFRRSKWWRRLTDAFRL